jgi:hypothetical protein
MKLTNQQIFDKALSGIRGQGYKQAVGKHTGCQYLTTAIAGEELRCAVGHCLPRDVATRWDYARSGQDTDILTMSEVHPEDFQALFSKDQLDFLSDLQGAHDFYLNYAEQWESRMQEIAYLYNLIYTPA